MSQYKPFSLCMCIAACVSCALHNNHNNTHSFTYLATTVICEQRKGIAEHKRLNELKKRENFVHNILFRMFIWGKAIMETLIWAMIENIIYDANTNM